MQLTLRQKLNIIVCAVTLAFIFLMAVSWYLNVEMENQTAIIRDQYIPHVELRYRMEKQFDNLALGLRDAVSAQDVSALDSTEALKNKLVNDLNAASGVV